jgi:hypothetical protein
MIRIILNNKKKRCINNRTNDIEFTMQLVKILYEAAGFQLFDGLSVSAVVFTPKDHYLQGYL